MTSPPTSSPTGARRVRRAPPTLVVVGAAAVLVALLGLVVPAAGSQLGLSVNRQPGAWTELYFTDAEASAGTAGCRVRGTRVTTRFTVVSHERDARRVDVRVMVRPVRGSAGRAVVRDESRVLRAGERSTVSAVLTAASRGAQEVVVTLPVTGAEITSRCGGSGT